MAIDLHECLLSDLRCEDLAERGLATSRLSHKQDGLSITKALLNENGQALELLGRDDLGQVKLRWYLVKDLTQMLTKV